MNKIKKIIGLIEEISGSYSGHQIFVDWCAMTAISISNACTLETSDEFKLREDVYKHIIGKYQRNDLEKFAEMTALLVLELEENPRDVLGEIYMQGSFGNKSTGQFFTPYNLSQLLAALTADESNRAQDGKIQICEPSCGGGGMIIAAAMELKSKGYNYQDELEVVAQDLDWNCVYMCYVQMSLLGISAVVVQGDTLCEPYSKDTPKQRVKDTPKQRVMVTPMKRGVLM